MEYRRMGKSGLQLSVLSFGSWVTFARQTDDDINERLMAQAYEAGVNFFDNAEVYAAGQSEEMMGRGLKTAALMCCPVKLFLAGKGRERNLTNMV